MSDRQVSMIATLIYVHFHHLRLQIVLYTNNQVPRRGRVGPACDCTGCGFCSLSNSSGSSTSRFSLASSSWSLLWSLQSTSIAVFGGCTIGTQSRAKQTILFATTGRLQARLVLQTFFAFTGNRLDQGLDLGGQDGLETIGSSSTANPFRLMSMAKPFLDLKVDPNRIQIVILWFLQV